MRAWNSITWQVADFFVYFLFPVLSVLLPAPWSRALVARVSRWQWLLAAKSDIAWNKACELLVTHNDQDSEQQWKMRWKQIELLDVRDLYLMTFGRSNSVLAEIDYAASLQAAQDRVMVGMHWGPSISILKLMAVADLTPAFLFRPPARHLLRSRPFYYLFLSLATRHMVKTMGERAVLVGGAGRKLGAMLDQAGSVVVLMDAPPMEGRPTSSSPVLNRNAVFNAGFPTILAEKCKQYMFYALSLHPDGSLRKRLELQGPFSTDDAQGFLQDYAGFLDRHLSADSAQWRLWHAAGQFWD